MLKPPQGTMLKKGHPLAKGLVGCWLFNEGPGVDVAHDLSGNGNDGTLTNMSPLSRSAGPDGFVLEFDGVDDYVSLGNSAALQLSSAFTVVVWVNAVVDGTDDYDPLINKGAGSGFRWIVGLHTDLGNARIGINSITDGYKYVTSSNGTIVNGQSYCIASVYDGGTLEGYIDGASFGSIAAAGGVNSPTSNDVEIQKSWIATPNYGISQMNAVSIYNRALTPEEVKQLSDNPYQIMGHDEN